MSLLNLAAELDNVLSAYEMGQFALAHNVSHGMGIYTARNIKNAWNVNFFVFIFAGASIAGGHGYLVGTLVILLRDIYRALSTLPFVEAIPSGFLQQSAQGSPHD